jgi:hypothetical protein
MKRALPFFISLLFLLMPLVSAQQQKVSVSEVEAGIEDYRNIGITEKGFEVKDPYALPIYEPKATSLLPFNEQISALLNSCLGNLLSTFDVKEAFALRILFEDIKPIFVLMGDLISIPLTCIALPFLSFVRLIKAPLDILQFLITAILDPILSIPADGIAIIERFSLVFKDLLHIPSLLLKPLEFLVYTPDPLAALASVSFSGLLRSFLSPLSAIASRISRAIDFIPALNIVKGLFTAYLLPLLRSLMDIPLSMMTYLLSPYRGALNVLLVPFSLLFTALNNLSSMIKTLLSFFVLPILFLLRIPLTPLLILFNFLRHSMQGFGQFLRSLSVTTPLLPAFLALLLLLSFLPSVAMSSLVSLAILLISLASSAVLSIALSALFSLAAFGLVLFGGVALSMITAGGSAIAGVVLGAIAGLIVGAVAGFLVGGVAGAIVGAIVGLLAGAVLGVVAGVIAGIILLITGAIAAIVVGGAAVVLGIVSILIEAVICLLLGIPTGGTIYIIEALFGAIGVVLIAAGIIGGILGFLLIAVLALLAGAAIIVIGAILGLVVGAVGGLILGAIAGILVGGILGLFAGALAGLVIGIATGLLAGAVMLLLTVPFAIIFAFVSGLAGLLLGSLPAVLITAAGSLMSLALLPLTALPLSAILFVLFLGASLVIISALALLSILSPTLFRVLVPPEVIEIAKRIALLPKDLARVINGLLHLPVDAMRAIAVLDDPAEIKDETVNATDNETSNATVNGEAGVIPYEAELEAENGDVIEEQPEEPVPEQTLPEETSEEVVPETPTPELEESTPGVSEEEPAPTEEEPIIIPYYRNVDDVIKQGNMFFANATGGLVMTPEYMSVLQYGHDRLKDLSNLIEDTKSALVYTYFLRGYSGRGSEKDYFSEDYAEYVSRRIAFEEKVQLYTNDGINEREQLELRKEAEELKKMNSAIKSGAENGRGSLKALVAGGYYDNETLKRLEGEFTWSDGTKGIYIGNLVGEKPGVLDSIVDFLLSDEKLLDERYKQYGGS